MSLVNVTWSTYVLPQHLSLAGKLGWQLTDGGWGGGVDHTQSHEKMP